MFSPNQVEHYRDLTAQAVELAEATDDPGLKAMHLDSALHWLALAQQAEYAAERLEALNVPLPTDDDGD